MHKYKNSEYNLNLNFKEEDIYNRSDIRANPDRKKLLDM